MISCAPRYRAAKKLPDTKQCNQIINERDGGDGENYVVDIRNHWVPRVPETNEARGTNKASLWPPRISIATPCRALIDAVLEFKYLKCLLVRTTLAVVSIAKKPLVSETCANLIRIHFLFI
jgi:hypothetical protein